jgi:hypothetical protein
MKMLKRFLPRCRRIGINNELWLASSAINENHALHLPHKKVVVTAPSTAAFGRKPTYLSESISPTK